MDETKIRLSERLGIPEETVRNHFRNREKSAAGYPRSIEVVKGYGLELAGDAYAFLVPFSATVSASEAVEKEQNLPAAAPAIGEGAVKTVFGMLYDVLSLYEASGGFNYIPGTRDRDGAWGYFEGMIERIRKMVISEFLGQRTGDTFKKLSNIIEETERFVKSFSIPGVADRWRTINPKIDYFDCVYDVIDEMGREAAKQMEQTGILSFRFFPDEPEVMKRALYFRIKRDKNERGNLQYSEERIFQTELLETLAMVFEHDFRSSVGR